MVDIPIHLKECTRIKRESKDSITLQVLCNCNCSTFYLLENILDEEENNIVKRFSKWTRVGNYIDPTTKIRYLVARNAFGKIFDKIPVNEIQNIPSIIRTYIIKVECSECGKQRIIFDNRYHGYDAIVMKEQFPIVHKEYQYRLMQKEAMKVEIKIRNESTYDEYAEDIKEIPKEPTKEEFSNAFSNIEIYGIKNGKKKKYFEAETA